MMELSELDPRVLSALIAAVVSIAGTFITLAFRRLYEPWLHSVKLKTEHEYEQRKKIKDAIARSKVSIANAAESLNYRLLNLRKNFNEPWLRPYSADDEEDRYYLFSFAYRLAALFGIAFHVSNQLLYLDSTFAKKGDLDFLKFVRLFPNILSDTELLDTGEVDPDNEIDHIYINNLEAICAPLIRDGTVISFSEFRENVALSEEFSKLLFFLYDLSPSSSAARWKRLEMMHLVLIMFLNEFGYDFQKTSAPKVANWFADTRELLPRFEKRLEGFRLSDNRSVRSVVSAVKGNTSRFRYFSFAK